MECSRKEIVDFVRLYAPKTLIGGVGLMSVFDQMHLMRPDRAYAYVNAIMSMYEDYKERVNEMNCNDDLEDILDLFYPEES